MKKGLKCTQRRIDMKLTLFPKTKWGKITLYFWISSIVLWIIMIAASSLMQLPFEGVFTSQGSLLLMGTIIAVTATNVACFFTGLFALIFKKDFSILVILAALIGANMLFTLVTLVYKVSSI
jgi:hypothetical protein